MKSMYKFENRSKRHLCPKALKSFKQWLVKTEQLEQSIARKRQVLDQKRQAVHEKDNEVEAKRQCLDIEPERRHQ